MKNNRIKAVLWDMDGTLFNTKRGIGLAVNAAARDAGLIPPDSVEIERFIGPPIQETFAKFYGMSKEEASEAAAIFRTYYREKNYVLESDPYPGLIEVLKDLREEGCFQAVCTLKKQDMAERIIRENGMDPLFDSIIGTDATDSIKKHDTIRMTCERLKISEKEAVLAGDTDFDALGAEKAGCLFIGVTYGFGFKSKEDVDRYPNIGTAASVRDIVDILKNYPQSS